MWGDRFEVLIATHLNRQHLHNHFVINSVSFADGKKYYDNKENYNLMKKISDRLCEENNLSVIRNPKSKGRHYAEVMAEKNGYPTIRGQIKDELDEIIKCSYTYEQFWKILKQRGYEVKRDVRYIALKPAYSQRYIRLKSLGKNYSEEAIRQRIIAARNGIQILDKPATDYNAWLKKYEPIKLHGFKALYYHYLYLFGKIRKKETPQRVSFYMREELIKFERYQKQFHFLIENDIETTDQLSSFKENTELKISESVIQRSRLYGKSDSTAEIKTINAELQKFRKDMRMCNNIFHDIETIREHQKTVELLKQETVEHNNRKVYKYQR